MFPLVRCCLMCEDKCAPERSTDTRSTRCVRFSTLQFLLERRARSTTSLRSLVDYVPSQQGKVQRNHETFDDTFDDP
jgi:hypothetical protein